MRVLIGAGVMLEPQMAAHAPELFAVLREPRLYDYLDDAPPHDEESVRARITKLESRLSPDGTEHWLNWIVRPADGALVGYVQATVYPDHLADIGYVIGIGHQRRGLAFAAVSAMLDELAASYEVTRLRAMVDPDNAGSVALLRKLGFTRTGGAEAGPLADIGFERSLP